MASTGYGEGNSAARQGAKRGRQTASLTQVRQTLGEGLRAKGPEIEQELLAAVGALEQDRDVDPEYAMGLRDSVPIALEYGIQGIESSETSPPPVPTQLYGQARLAARNGVKLSTVLSRYVSGYNLLQAFADEIAEAEGIVGSSVLREVRRVGQLALERLTATVSEQHEDESNRWASSPEWRKAVLVRKLLDGERVDTSQLNYDLDGFHVGLVVSGTGADTAIKGLAQALDCISLSVNIPDDQTWAWLGRRKPPEIDRIEEMVRERWPEQSRLSIGEIGQGLVGWRYTHRQAKAGFPVSLKRREPFRYGDDPILVTLLREPLLAESFQQMYIAPLSGESDRAEKLRSTLCAYFVAERNAASAAELLGVNRQTVKNHLQQVEKALKRPLSSCIAELEACLRLDGLLTSDPGG